jgi:hypothetical protein
MDGARVPIALDLYAKHPVKLTEIGDFYMLAETGLELIDKAEIARGDGAVVDMDSDDDDFVFLVEYSLVDRTLLET